MSHRAMEEARARIQRVVSSMVELSERDAGPRTRVYQVQLLLLLLASAGR